MKPQMLNRKIGIQSISDQKTGIYFELPKGFLIYNHNGRVWVGGSGDNQYYFHVERIATGNGEIPTLLAEGDLDLFLASVGAVENLDINTQGIDVSGSLASRSISGYLAMISSGKISYLVLVASSGNGKQKSCKHIAIQATQKIAGSLGSSSTAGFSQLDVLNGLTVAR